MDLPDLVIAVGIEPDTKADEEKLAQGLSQLMAGDPSFAFTSDQQTGRAVISGTGELQQEVLVDRLTREFNVAAAIGQPQVAYRRTIRKSAEGDGCYLRQIGGYRQFAQVKIRIEALPPGAGIRFADNLPAGCLPKQYIDAAEAGLRSNHSMWDVNVTLINGAYHATDSLEFAFRIAGLGAFLDAVKKAETALLEPVMRVEIVVEEAYTEVLSRDLANRRGYLQPEEDRQGTNIISARVPLASMLGYGADLRALTQGRASFTMHFDRYEPLRNGRDSDDDEGLAPVTAPLTPAPKTNQSRVALPEPDDPGISPTA